MSPLQVQIMLHYRCCADDFRNGDFSAPAVRREIDNFVKSGMIFLQPTRLGCHTTYAITEKGTAYTDAVCAIPEPVCKWVIA